MIIVDDLVQTGGTLIECAKVIIYTYTYTYVCVCVCVCLCACIIKVWGF